MRKLLIVLLCLLPLAALAESLPIYPYGTNGDVVKEFTSPTLWWRIEKMQVEGVTCYLTKVCMEDPGQQIGKAGSDWRQNTMSVEKIAAREPDASLIINGSGYVTRTYPWIPENYPGVSEDYYFTPLGSLTVTDGEVLRHLPGVPYYGLTLNRDGLRLHVADDPQEVLDEEPTQTWSFYVECPIIEHHQSILDPAWKFTSFPAMRNIICKIDANNYLIMIVTRSRGGLTMQQCVDYLMAAFDPEWAYNLDGGPSAALMYRSKTGRLITVWEPGQRTVDIMTFSELKEVPEE